MSGEKRVPRFEGLVAEVLAGLDKSQRKPASTLSLIHDEGTRLQRREYGRSLRKCLGRSEVREIISEAKRTAWPRLNQEAVRLGSMQEFAARAFNLGVDFRIAKMPWPSGLALFGFYVSGGPGFEKRPLICVNGAHHPAAIGTAFAHEVGHHVTADLFGVHEEAPQLLAQRGYEGHLSDPRELAADVMVSLGIYPHDTAMKLFGSGPREKGEPAKRRLNPRKLSAALSYVGPRYGFDLESVSSQKRVQYQAGLIHFTKLREALLVEYGI
ncbi:MAG TPA: hypothetical protein VIX59_06780 [Candidatus Binataceae bacterium]